VTWAGATMFVLEGPVYSPGSSRIRSPGSARDIASAIDASAVAAERPAPDTPLLFTNLRTHKGRLAHTVQFMG